MIPARQQAGQTPMLDLTPLRVVFPSAVTMDLDRLVAEAPAVFHRNRLDAGRDRGHFFLAQIAHESDGLRLREENLNYSAARLMQVWPARFPSLAAAAPFARDPEKLAEQVYGGRMGNVRPGDGYRFRGRGYLQITGRDGYRLVGHHAGLDLEHQPELAADPEHALAIAGAFWMWKRLNPLCDQGDFATVTRRINGGLVGLQDRFAWLDRIQRALPWSAPGAIALGQARLKAVQAALRDRGLYDGSIDGIIGRRSLAAIATLRLEEDLPAGGGLDGAVLEALGV
jgi:putative chitinase